VHTAVIWMFSQLAKAKIKRTSTSEVKRASYPGGGFFLFY